jgi:hypothetical protein
LVERAGCKEFRKGTTINLFIIKVDLNVELVTKSYCTKIEQCLDEALSNKKTQDGKQQEFKSVPAQLILLPDQAPYRLSNFGQQDFAIGDRVKFVTNVGSVGLGALGTVIGIATLLIYNV